MKKIVCQCGKKIRIYEKVRGRNGKCPRCNRTINVSANIWNTPPEIAELQNYSIIREISRGNVGTIYEAIDKEEKRYAIKIAHSSRENNILQNEYDILQKIVHKNIVEYQKLDTYNNRVYLVMNFIDGKSLEEVLFSIPKQLPFVLSLQIVYKLAKAIGYLHDYNVAHLNIKPANIMFSSDYDLKVINFAVAKYIGDVSLVSSNEYSHYLAPEQRVRQRAQSSWDIYSLGCILFELLTGETLVSDEDLFKSKPLIDTPSKINATIPEEISTICSKAVHLDPQKRYTSMTQLAYDIENYLGNIQESLSTQLQKYFKQLHSSGTFESINPSISIEKEFGSYKILQFSHRDSYGVIYKAIDSKTNKIVTLKALLNTREDETAKKSFTTSMNAIQKIDHPHIAKAFHFDTKPQKYYVMEYLWGKPITTLIGNSNYKKITSIFYEISLALDHVHSKVIHGNLRPSNILVNENLHPKIFDFGLTYLYEKSFLLKKNNIYYISPQQLQDNITNKQTDVYSLGAILYHILTKRPPFEGSKNSILQQIVTHTPIAPRLLNPDIPEALEAICMKSIHKSPQKRYASARELSQDLKKVIERNYVVAKTPPWHIVVNTIAICFFCFACLGLYNMYLTQKEQNRVLFYKIQNMTKEKAIAHFQNSQWKMAALTATQVQGNFATTTIYKSYINSKVKWRIDRTFEQVKSSATQKYIIGIKNNSVYVIDPKTAQILSKRTFSQQIYSAVSIAENIIQIFFVDTSAILWNYQQQKIIQKTFLPTEKTYKTNAKYILYNNKNQVFLSDIQTNNEITSWDIRSTNTQIGNSSLIAISTKDSTTIWDVDTPVFSHPGRAYKMKFFLKWFALYDKKCIWIYDTTTKSVHQKIPIAHLRDFAFINNTTIALLKQNNLDIFSLKIKKRETAITISHIQKIIHSPVKNTLILCGKEISAIEIKSRTVPKVKPLQQQQSKIQQLPLYIQKMHPNYQKQAVSFDQKLIAILDDGVIYIWNAPKKKLVTSIFISGTPQQEIQSYQFVQNDILEITTKKQKQFVQILDPDLKTNTPQQEEIHRNPSLALKYIFSSKKDKK